MIRRGQPPTLGGLLYHKHGKSFGTAIHPHILPVSGDFIAKNYYHLIPEVVGKLDWIRPSPNVFDLRPLSEILSFAKEHSMKVHYHTFRWHFIQAIPQWIQDLDVPSRRDVMKETIITVLNYFQDEFPGVVDAADIANEGYHVNGGDYGNGDFWHTACSVEDVYTWAMLSKWEGKLFYADFNTSPAWQETVWQRLVKPGLIDGVSFQGHMSAKTNLAELVPFVHSLYDAGVSFRVTEADVCDEDPEKTRQIWKDLGIFVRDNPINVFMTWGISNPSSWLAPNKSCISPLIFDVGQHGEYEPNPSYETLYEVFDE